MRKTRYIPALANGDDITDLGLEARGDVGRDVLVTLLVTVVLRDPVEVVTTDNDGALHLGADDGTTEDTATNAHVAGERALLVNVVVLDGSLRGLEAKSDILPVAGLATHLAAEDALAANENGRLLLESAFLLLVSDTRDDRSHSYLLKTVQ